MNQGQFIFLGLPVVFAAGMALYLFVEEESIFTINEHLIVLLVGIGLFLLGVFLNLIFGLNLKENIIFVRQTPSAILFFVPYTIFYFWVFNIIGNLAKLLIKKLTEYKKRRRYRVRT